MIVSTKNWWTLCSYIEWVSSRWGGWTLTEEAGKLVGSKEQQAKGLAKQVSGKAEKAYGDAREGIKDTVK